MLNAANIPKSWLSEESALSALNFAVKAVVDGKIL